MIGRANDAALGDDQVAERVEPELVVGDAHRHRPATGVEHRNRGAHQGGYPHQLQSHVGAPGGLYRGDHVAAAIDADRSVALGGRELHGVHVDGEHQARPEGPGHLHRGETEATRPEHHDALPRPHGGAP